MDATTPTGTAANDAALDRAIAATIASINRLDDLGLEPVEPATIFTPLRDD